MAQAPSVALSWMDIISELLSVSWHILACSFDQSGTIEIPVLAAVEGDSSHDGHLW